MGLRLYIRRMRLENRRGRRRASRCVTSSRACCTAVYRATDTWHGLRTCYTANFGRPANVHAWKGSLIDKLNPLRDDLTHFQLQDVAQGHIKYNTIIRDKNRVILSIRIIVSLRYKRKKKIFHLIYLVDITIIF